MIITEILGGLGNQLFEYAHARSLSIKLEQELYFDLSFFDRYHRKDVYRLDRFNTNVNNASEEDINRLKRKYRTPDIFRKVINKLGGSPYSNSKYHFDNERIDKTSIKVLKQYKDLYISGYFANQKYFMVIEDIIRKEFTLKEPLNIENQKMFDLINSTPSVSLHIRRGDYVGNGFFAEIPLSYYHDAVTIIEKKYPKSTYYIFSDDLQWVKENLTLNVNTIYVDINDSSTDYMELMLMAACKHNIIANSTFSWWGAWLNSNSEKIVIAPKIWFNNKEAQAKYNNGKLVPVNWIKI